MRRKMPRSLFNPSEHILVSSEPSSKPWRIDCHNPDSHPFTPKPRTPEGESGAGAHRATIGRTPQGDDALTGELGQGLHVQRLAVSFLAQLWDQVLDSLFAESLATHPVLNSLHPRLARCSVRMRDAVQCHAIVTHDKTAVRRTRSSQSFQCSAIRSSLILPTLMLNHPALITSLLNRQPQDTPKLVALLGVECA